MTEIQGRFRRYFRNLGPEGRGFGLVFLRGPLNPAAFSQHVIGALTVMGVNNINELRRCRIIIRRIRRVAT